MRLIKHFRVGQKGIEAGFSAEINGPPAILRLRKILSVRVAEDSPAHGRKSRQGQNTFLLIAQLSNLPTIFTQGRVKTSSLCGDSSNSEDKS